MADLSHPQEIDEALLSVSVADAIRNGQVFPARRVDFSVPSLCPIFRESRFAGGWGDLMQSPMFVAGAGGGCQTELGVHVRASVRRRHNFRIHRIGVGIRPNAFEFGPTLVP